MSIWKGGRKGKRKGLLNGHGIEIAIGEREINSSPALYGDKRSFLQHVSKLVKSR